MGYYQIVRLSLFNSVDLVPLHPIIVSILFPHYEELKERISDLERIETNICSENKRLTIKEGEVTSTILGSYCVKNKNYK